MAAMRRLVSSISAWVVGWNHVARQILRLDPGYPDNVGRGPESGIVAELGSYSGSGTSGMQWSV